MHTSCNFLRIEYADVQLALAIYGSQPTGTRLLHSLVANIPDCFKLCFEVGPPICGIRLSSVADACKRSLVFGEPVCRSALLALFEIYNGKFDLQNGLNSGIVNDEPSGRGKRRRGDRDVLRRLALGHIPLANHGWTCSVR